MTSASQDQPVLPAPQAQALALALEAPLGARVSAVEPPVALSGGASRQTWRSDVTTDDGNQVPIVIRCNPVSASESMELEAHCLRAAHAAGVPVPMVLYASDRPEHFPTATMIMTRIEGETIGRRVLTDPALGAARAVLTGQCGRALASIHSVEVRSIPALPERPDPLVRIADTLARNRGRYPVLDAALAWLDDHRPTPTPGGPVLVHGDFRLGNLIVDADGLQAVLDWELAHIGDPAEDLAWLCTKAWRFGGAGIVGGFGARPELLDAYRGAGGRDVSAATLDWWQAASTLKWAVMCIEQADLYRRGDEDSLELLALGRRVSESEWDLLDELDGPELSRYLDTAAHSTPEPTPLISGPDARELVGAVSRFLREQIVADTDGRTRYLTRVAANMLDIAARELAADDGGVARTQPDPRAAVLARLKIDNPRYLSTSATAGDVRACGD